MRELFTVDRSPPLTVHHSSEVFRAFLKLGLTAFGGPIAHLGYFRDEFVVRRRWLDDTSFTDLVALCQFLPGPASSQLGVCLGLMRAGYVGGLAAWLGFTLPAAIAMVIFACSAPALGDRAGQGLVHGLKLVAVAIVAQALWGMARTLCPDRQRASIAALAMVTMLLSNSSGSQIAVIVFGGLAGLWICRTSASRAAPPVAVRVSRRVGLAALALFTLLLMAVPMFGRFESTDVRLFEAFYRSGALVFGGGHVVLPLLRDAIARPGWVSDSAFLTGYAAAQAVPGPLFTFAAYLGVLAAPSHRLAGAVLGLFGIFLPGMLILVGVLPFWDLLRARASAQAAMRGVNAAVVGLLGAAFHTPVWSTSIHDIPDLCVALTCFVLLTVWRTPPFLAVLLGALAGIALR